MNYKYLVAPDFIRGCAALSALKGKQEALARIKSGPTMALALAVFAVPVQAQQTDSCQEGSDGCIVIGDTLKRDDFRTDIVVTATGARQESRETGEAVTVLSRDAIETRQLPAVSDLLGQTPGVTVSRNGGIGQPTAVRIRGAEGEQTLVLIDGVRVNDPSSPGGAFDFGNLLTNNIARIEVLRGPNSVPWGSQALGGVVNITTAAPTATPTANLRGEYGYKNAVQAVGNVSGTLGPVAASLGAGYFRDDGISAYKFGAERDGYRQYAANARVAVTLTPDVGLDLRGNYADSRVGFDGFPPPNFTFADTADYSKTQQAFGYAGINATLFGGALKNRVAFTLADTRRQSFTPPIALPSRFAGRSERYEYQGDATISSAVRAVFGIEHEDSRFNDGKTTTTTGVTSGYLQAIVTPFDALTVTGGARVDDHRTYGTKATFSANAALRLGSGTVLRASYGEGFKAPTLFQLYSFYGNRALLPETAKSYDFGVEQSLLNGALRLGATIFRRDTVNQIGFAFTSARPSGVYANIARSRAEGVEATIEMRPTSTLSFIANYTFIAATNRATGIDLLRRPKHNVSASIDWSGLHWLRLGATLQTVSDSRDSDFQTFRPVSLDGYALASIRASLPLGDRFEVYGRIENLFDQSYETVSGYGVYPRNAHIGVRVKL